MSERTPEKTPEVTPATTPHLSCQMKHQLGALHIDVAFELTQPWTVLFGPSGTGKSTVLRAIAGLLRPDQGRIVLRTNQREQILIDTARKIHVPAHKRAVRWTAQRPALFPHLTVRQNLAIAVEGDRSLERQAAETAIEHFRLASLANSMPATLSGGEQHRVALARAAVAAAVSTNGHLLLLDEPFTGLDAPLRDALLDDLRVWLARSNTPVLSVTHDIGEAFLLGAEIIRLQAGRVVQQGPATEVLAAERARLLAQLR